MLRHLHPNSGQHSFYSTEFEGALLSSSWREATVIPTLSRARWQQIPLSYRPIALTSCFCKTFERMVNTRLVYAFFLEKENVFSLQSGFPARADPLLITLFFRIPNQGCLC
ncbi:hypothetical protein TNCV_3875041 [Trichonephila clavipes]|nr:hypothetical protein TNCV_3875041 [Trichonephila clavipes]